MAWDHKGSRHERGYGYQWTKRREQALKRDRYLCQPCERQGKYAPAREVDHILPKSKDGTDEYDNLQSICRACHAAKTAREAQSKGRKKSFGVDGWPIE